MFNIIDFIKEKNIQNHLDQTTETYTNSFETIHDQYRKLSYIIFTGIEHTSRLEEKLVQYKNRTTDMNSIRNGIINNIEKRFELLQEQHIKSINIILWDGTMLLNMKDLKRYGKKISEKRLLIREAITKKQPINGYEIGKFGEGFRFIYPVFSSSKEYLGIVELVFDPSAITDSIMKQYNVFSNFFIKAQNFDKKYLTTTKKYLPSHHNGFLFSKSVLRELKKISHIKMRNLKPSKKTTSILYQNFSKGKPISHYDDSIHAIITSIPIIHPITKDTDAVLTIRSPGDKLYQMMQYLNILHILTIGFIFIFCIALYIKYLSNLKNQETSKKIRQLQERFELAMDATKDGIWDWNPVTDEVYYSKTWKKMLGFKESEIKPSLEEWKSRIHKNDLEKTMTDVQNHLQHKTPIYENIHRVKHKKGHWIWILDRGKALFNEQGKPYRMIGFHTDITKQKQLEHDAFNRERQLFNQEKMAQMGEMIGNIAHQWRQPLSIITTLATGMKMEKEFHTLDDEKFLKNCDLINDNAQYLSETINTFRGFIRDENEQKEIVLQQRLDEILKILEASLTNNYITIYNETKNTKDIRVTLVANELDQVIINIINNSKDAIIGNNIQNGWVKLQIKRENNHALITVEDNGGGIPKKILPNIFDPYFTTKHKSQGTGLGLHMSYRIVTESFKGRLYAKNSQNGAKFFIELPLIN